MLTRTHIVDGSVREFAWDHRNRLTGIIDRSSAAGPVTQSIRYTYDAFDNLVSRLFDSNGDSAGGDDKTYYIWDSDRVVMLYHDPDGGGAAQAPALSDRFVWGPGTDFALAAEHFVAGASAAVYWAMVDYQGTVMDILGASGLLEARRFDAFGNLMQEVGPSPVYESISTMWGYTGRSSDAASGLQFNRARWYDPTIGRFISEDPSGFVGGQDTNPYRYVFNNPLVGTDPSGLALQGLSATVSSAWNNFTSSLNSAWNNLAGTISSNITNLANTIGSTISSLGHAFEGIHYTSGPSTNESEYGSGYAPSRTIVHEPAIIDGRRMAVVDVIGYRYPINDLSWDDSWEIDSYDPDYPDHLWPPPKIVNTSRWGIMKAAIGGFFSGLGEFPRFAGQQIRRGGDAFGGGLERSGVWVGQSFNRVTGLELPGVLITGGVGFVGDVVRTTGNIAGGVVDLPGTVVSTAEGLSDRYAGYRYMGLGVWDAGVMTAHPMLGMTEAYRGQSYGPTDFGRSLDLLERGTRGSLSLSATAGLTAPAANAILRRLVSVPRTYQLPTSSVVRAADGTLSLQLAPESQGVFNLTARFENVPPSMWGTFPAGVPRPTGPINLLTGDAYTAARQAANAANRPLSQGFGLGPADFQIHEIVPVKFGGSPTALSNKVGVYAPVHRQVSAWFNRLQRLMEGGN